MPLIPKELVPARSKCLNTIVHGRQHSGQHLMQDMHAGKYWVALSKSSCPARITDCATLYLIICLKED